MRSFSILGAIVLNLASCSCAWAKSESEKIETIWPLCSGWQTKLESWQWIIPAELTSDNAMEATRRLSAVEGQAVQGEAGMVFRHDEQILEGYRLLVLAKEAAASLPKESIAAARVRQKERVAQFCAWITTNAFPE